MKDTFASYHPVLSFTYFCAVILFGMLFLHPVFLAVGIAAAFCYSVFQNGKRAVFFNLCFLLPSMILVSLINPLFNHRGITILGYMGNNPITKESILYGVATGMMFACIILWFSCYNAVMTSDKFVYLFGKVIPAMSLILSMALRFVPKFKTQIAIISDAQKCIGRDAGSGTLKERLRNGIKIISIMTTWALESAAETADSMNARGYGLPGRSAFSLYRFDSRDKGLLVLLIGLSAVVAAGGFLGYNTMQFFPSIKLKEADPAGAAFYAAYGILCFLPLIINGKESLKWKRLQSGI